MKPLLNDQTVSTLDAPDGGKVQIPTLLLSPAEAALLGEVETWLSRERLDRKLWCKACGFDAEVDVFVEPQEIGIKCDCRILFYQGPVPVTRTTHPHEGEALIAPVRVVIPDVPLSVADAFMWRRYDKFLWQHGYKEALWCGVCEDEGNHAGLRAEISVSQVSFLCRHAHRVFSGISA